MLEKKQILVVEDNSFVAYDIAQAIEHCAAHVIGPVATVAEAILLLDSETVEGAVLDCQLADRDISPVALTLLDRNIPFVVHSGTGLPEGLLHRADEIILVPKPLAPEVVISALDLLCPGPDNDSSPAPEATIPDVEAGKLS